MSASKPLWSLLDMLKPYGSLVITTYEILRELDHIAERQSPLAGYEDDTVKEFVRARLPLIHGINEQIPIQSSVDQAERIKTLMGDGSSGDKVLRAFQELRNRFTDDLKHIQFFSVRKDLTSLYGSKELFGPLVAQKFPALLTEVEDAGSAFALERWTASAFHSIRCLEAGIRALTRCLGIPDPTRGSDRNWSSVLRSVKAETDHRWPSATDKMTADYMTFDGIFGALSALQNPYRNETMHLEARYDEGEARHIMEMARGLMQKIAARCDENGDPKV
jgi:hypothetical protein